MTELDRPAVIHWRGLKLKPFSHQPGPDMNPHRWDCPILSNDGRELACINLEKSGADWISWVDGVSPVVRGAATTALDVAMLAALESRPDLIPEARDLGLVAS